MAAVTTAGSRDPAPLPLIVRMLREPAAAGRLSPADWSVLVQQGRASGLLARLDAGLLDPSPAGIPAAALGHLRAARRVCRAQHAEVLREAGWIDHALAALGVPVVLLKGAAYAVAGLPAAAGRVYGDVDILVPRSALEAVEARLLQHGWISTETSAYNQQYYRRWMHELPPMQHLHRGTTIDVHHALLPPTSRLRSNPAPLLGDALPLPGWRTLHRLAPADMVLHAATHLMLNDDVTHALRDLSDLDLLLRGFAAGDVQGAAFWPQLLERARQLGLTRPLHHALPQLQRVWGTPVPPAIADAVAADAPWLPAAAVMRRVWPQVLQPPAPGPAPLARRLAESALLLRGHWLRMPLPLLVRHLSVKALRLHERRPSAAAAGNAG